MWNYLATRMHSSRMPTVRCSGRLFCYAHPPATHTWVTPPFAMHAAFCHACPPFAMHAPLSPCMPPCHTHPLCQTCPLVATHAPPWTEWQTLVKTLPFCKLLLRTVTILIFNTLHWNYNPLYSAGNMLADISHIKCIHVCTACIIHKGLRVREPLIRYKKLQNLQKKGLP